MARPMWSGHISFGLVSIPVTVFSAELPQELSFHLRDQRNNARVRYTRVNEESGKEVPWGEIVKSYDLEDDKFVLLSDADFRQAAVEQTKTIDIEDFVELDEIPYYFFEKPYYLVPGPKGEKGYALLRETLRRTNKVGIAKIVLRTRQYLAALLTEGDMLVLNVLRFAHELRDPAEYDVPGKDFRSLRITEKELEMAQSLVEAMTADWKPAKYHDDYTDKLLKYIERKAKSGKIAAAPEAEEEPDETEGAEVIDIMSLLQKSVRGKKGRRSSESGEAKERHAARAPRRASRSKAATPTARRKAAKR